MSKEVIFFSGQTCAPCKQLKPEMEFQAQHRGFAMRIVDMCHENKDEFLKYGVRSVPTVVCHDGENEIGRFVGAQTSIGVEASLAAWGL